MLNYEEYICLGINYLILTAWEEAGFSRVLPVVRTLEKPASSQAVKMRQFIPKQIYYQRLRRTLNSRASTTNKL